MTDTNGNGKPKQKRATRPLNPRHQAFVLALVNPEVTGDDYARAADMAGYEPTEKRTLHQIGLQLASQPKIQAALREAAVAEAQEPGWCERRLTLLAMSDMENFADGDNGVSWEQGLKNGAICQIKKYKKTSWTDKEGIVHVNEIFELHDPLAATIALAKMRGELSENVHHHGSISIADKVDPIIADPTLNKLANDYERRMASIARSDDEPSN